MASSTSATVSWSKAGNPASQNFRLEYRVQGSTATPSAQVYSGESDAEISKTVTGLTSGSVYEFRVRSTGHSGHTPSDWTDWVTARDPWYVSNVGQTAGATAFDRPTTSLAQAQRFATGSQSGGYALGSVDVVIRNAPTTEAQRDTVRAELWSAVASGASAGQPSAKIADLAVPAHPITAGTVRFTAPANTTLSANTGYNVVVYTTGNFNLALVRTGSGDEDSGGATGWSIDNKSWNPSSGSDTNVPSGITSWGKSGGAAFSLQISVNPPPPASMPTITLSSDASGDTAAEGGSAVTITAELSEAAPTGGVTVTLARQSASTATATSDYTLAAETITVAVGETTGTVRLTIVDDSAVEAHETVVLSGTASGHTASADLTVTINDNDTPAKPTVLTATARDAALGLTWTAPAGVLEGYDVHYTSASKMGDSPVADDASLRTDNDATKGWADASHTGTMASHTISSLSNGTEYRVRVRAVSAAGDGAFEFTTGTPEEAASSNADLSALTAKSAASSGGTFTALTLMPSTFDKGTTSYTATVENGRTHVKLRPTVDDSTASVTVEGTAVTSGMDSAAIALDVGANALAVEVTAEDGVTTKTYTVTITRKPKVTLTISSGTVGEAAGNRTKTITATLSEAAPTGGVTVTLAKSGTATDMTDYTLAGTITVADTETTGTATLTITDDKVDEDDETLDLEARATGHTSGSLSVTIVDNDTRGVTISQTARTVEVGEVTTYKVKLNSQPTGNVVITPTSSNTAKATVSTAAANNKLAFTTSNWNQPQTVTITGKAAGTGLKVTHAVTTGNAAGKYPTTLAIGEVALTVNPSTKTFAITATASGNEGDTVDLTVTLGRAPTDSAGHTLSVAYGATTASDDVDAVAADRSSAPTSVTVAQGDTTATLSVTLATDTLVEGTEKFEVRISTSATGWNAAGTGKDTATVTINDETEAEIALHATDAGATTTLELTVDENVASGSVNVPVTISNRPAVSTTFTIEVATGGTATEYTSASNPGDFRIATKTVSFGPSDTANASGTFTKNVAVTINNDTLVEHDQTIKLQIKAADNPVNDVGDLYARHASGSKATITIHDDDDDAAKIAFGTNPAATAELTPSVAENVSGGKLSVPITISRRPETNTTFTVSLRTSPGGTATPYAPGPPPVDGDFRIVTSSVTFGPGDTVNSSGNTTKNLEITITNDALVEEDQTILLEIDDSSGDLGTYYTRDTASNGDTDGVASEATVTIQDDERPKAKIAFGSSAGSMIGLIRDVEEDLTGGKLTVPITISALPESAVTFTVAVAGTATEDTDYSIASKSFEFTDSGALTQNLEITLTDDKLVEADQTIELSIEAADDPVNDLGDHYARDSLGSRAIVTIGDDEQDDAKIAISISDLSPSPELTTKSTYSANEGGATSLAIAINYIPESAVTFTLDLSGSARGSADPANSAGNPKDYDLTYNDVASKQVTFDPAGLSGAGPYVLYMVFTAVDDTVEEDNETVEFAVATADSPVNDLGDYYARDANGSKATATIVSDDVVSTVTLSINRTGDRSSGALLYRVTEGTDVTVTATADIPVGPRGWQVTTENVHVTEGRFRMLIIGQCGGPPYNYNVFACPNDYVLPATFTIEEGQTTATGTLRINTDPPSRDGGREERLALRADAVRDADGDGSTDDDKTLTTETLDLRLNDSAVGVSVGALASDLVPGETATYTVSLRGAAPTADVTITPTSGDTDTATVAPASLTFDSSNYQDPQTFTVTGVAAGSATITHAVASDDTTYGSLAQLGSVDVTVKTAVKNYQIQMSATGAEGGNAELTVTLGDIAPTGGLEFAVDRSRVAGRIHVGPLPPGTPRPHPSADAGLANAADRDSPPATLTVAAGKRTATLSEPLADDDRVEGTEHYFVTISTSTAGWSAVPTNNTVEPDYETCDEIPVCAKVTITDTDAEDAKIAFGNAADATAAYTADVAEGAGTLLVPVTVSALPKAQTTFGIEVVSTGTAAEGTDYTIGTKSVTFGPSDSSTTKNVSVAITDDSDVEGAETILLRLAAADNPVDDLGDHYRRDPSGNSSQATLTINDNDGAVVVDRSAVTVATGGTVTYTVKLDGAQPGGTVTIAVASDDTDTATVDTATLDFTTGNWNQPQTVTVTGVAAGTATISHTISTAQTGYPTGLTIDSVAVTVSALPTVSLGATSSVAEGSAVTVTISLSERLDIPTKTIPIVLTAGTAEPGDYGALANIPIDNVSTTFTATITTADDDDTEDETFTVALGDTLPSSVTRGTPASVVVTITDPDRNAVSLSASPNPVPEGDPVTITATLTSALSNEIVIPLTITNGTAEDADRGALAEITIAAGATSGTGEIDTHQDADAIDETFTVALGALPPGVDEAGTRSVTITIDDDEGTTRTPPRPPTRRGPGGGGGSAQSDDADLSAVSLAGGGGSVVLDQVFSADTTAYTAQVAHHTDQITIDADPAHSAAEVAIEPADADPDAPGHQVNLDVGPNTITVAVTAQDDTQKTYTVTVTRAPQPDSAVTQQDIELRDDLVFAQEALLNVYRCLFGVDAHIVPGGCNGTEPAQQPARPAPFEGTPTVEEQELRDRLVADQEALLNAYRCMFDVDTHIVPGGCIDGRPAEAQ